MTTFTTRFLLHVLVCLYLATFSLDAAQQNLAGYPHLTHTLSECFPNTPVDEIQIAELKGGFSGTSLYKIKADGNTYVLRILQSQQVNDQNTLELFCLKEASQMGISPKIHYVSSDGKVILMEHVDGKTLSMDQANFTDNVVRLAQAFQKAHQMTGHPIEGQSLLSKAEMCFAVINFHLVPDEQIVHAYELIQNYTLELQDCEYEKVHVHGDLNPRNIFLTDNKVYLIDWAETTMEDPFYDLAYFSLMLCYDKSNEELLLKSYLERSPTNKEWHRYNLHKKIHQAFWSMTNLYLTHIELQKHQEQRIIFDSTPKNWKFYQKTFSDYLEEIPAQYFYDLSRLCYQRSLPECP